MHRLNIDNLSHTNPLQTVEYAYKSARPELNYFTINKNANARTSHCMQKGEGLEYKIKTEETK